MTRAFHEPLGSWISSKPSPVAVPTIIELSAFHDTADTSRSDLDLAGLMLRCSEKDVDLVIVMVTPLPPQARPSVTIGANGIERRFDASIVSPGAELLLPAEAMTFARGVWQSAHELSIRVTWTQGSVGGVVPIDGLADALATLPPKCPIR